MNRHHESGKSCGVDGIAPEVLKWVLIDDLELHISNKAFMDRELPRHWTIINIIPIPKSGDLTKTDNYRGISLSSVVAKVYNRMILNRIRPKLDPWLLQLPRRADDPGWGNFLCRPHRDTVFTAKEHERESTCRPYRHQLIFEESTIPGVLVSRVYKHPSLRRHMWCVCNLR